MENHSIQDATSAANTTFIDVSKYGEETGFIAGIHGSSLE